MINVLKKIVYIFQHYAPETFYVNTGNKLKMVMMEMATLSTPAYCSPPVMHQRPMLTAWWTVVVGHASLMGRNEENVNQLAVQMLHTAMAGASTRLGLRG